jgi:hypothetical protein
MAKLNVLPGMEAFAEQVGGDGPKVRYPANGYAATPGFGPKGETCRTCKHLVRRHYNRVHLKCGLIEYRWTNSYGTDVLAKSPACKLFEKAR